MLEFLPKQVQLMNAKADVILYGGARGGAKTMGTALAIALEVIEIYTDREMSERGINKKGFRMKIDNGIRIFYKYLIDYRNYMGVVARRTIPAINTNTLVEMGKVYPYFRGKFNKKDYCWRFPSGAKIYLRPLSDDDTLEFFQGPNFHRFVVEELTQYEQEMIEMAESCCRSAEPIDDSFRIPAKIIYTTNPGGRGHKWVKEKFVDVCPPLPDGEQIYVPKFDIYYQPLKANKPYVTKSGERLLFIPSLVFDNPHLAEKDERYVSNLLNKNKILQSMWLFGRWDKFAGQFFDMWNEDKHVIDEYEFYKVKGAVELIEARRLFDWKENGYRLYMSNDYGFSEKSAWACGMYAVAKDMSIIKFDEIVESGLSIVEQAQYTKKILHDRHRLYIDDFDIVVADPKSYWETRDAGSNFYTFYDEYAKEGIYLTKGKNDRVTGAAAMVDALRMQPNGLPRMRHLSCCQNTNSSIPNLPADPRNPNDVDTKTFDHCYDEERYFLMMLLGGFVEINLDKKDTSFRAKLKAGIIANETVQGEFARDYLSY